MNEIGCKCGCNCSCSAGAPCICTRGESWSALEKVAADAEKRVAKQIREIRALKKQLKESEATHRVVVRRVFSVDQFFIHRTGKPAP
jgi:hypothetical protein